MTSSLYYQQRMIANPLPRQYYERCIATLTSRVLARRRRNRLFVVGEIATFALFVAFIAAYAMVGWGWCAVLLAAMSLTGYAAIRRLDERNEARTEWLEALREVCRREECYLDGDFSAFDEGERYAVSSHPFTTDMDVFGRASLYQRICRAVTSGGSGRLAAMLSSQPVDVAAADITSSFYCNLSPVERIRQRADAIDALAVETRWRTDFCAVAVDGTIDTDAVAQAMHNVRDVQVGKWVMSPATLLVAALLVSGFLIAVLLAVFADLPSSVAVTWGVLQLGLVLGMCHGRLMAVSRAVGKLQRQMKAYVRVIGLINDGRVPVEASGLLRRVVEATSGAGQSFREVERILAGLDRRGNLLGLIFSDIFTLSDFRLLRRFARWQQRHILDMDSWIASVNEMDALVSMATFRYNEPHGTRAEVVNGTDIVYEAHGLYHPFLGQGAVSNDFVISERNYYIITGANMAGKSTFLRSLGINWLLAMNGLPVFASSLRLSVFPLFTSMRTSDDLTRGISYFNAELLRLKSLIAFCAVHCNTLIILDEILKGTNSADKLGGSRLFLEYISQRRVTGVIATHDLELSRLADEQPKRFHNYCFEIELGRDVTYTYKITPGVARNQNATYLLRQLLC